MGHLEFVEPAVNTAFVIDAGTAESGPRMPEITARVRFVDVELPPGASVYYVWAARVRYPGQLTCLSPPPREITDDFLQKTSGPDWTFTFPRIRGGQLTLQCEARVSNGQIFRASRAQLVIRGANPPREELHAVLAHPVLRQVCARESGQRQFLANPFGGASVHPLWGDDGMGGVGLMQVLEPPPTDDEVWNWKANALRGIKQFKDRLTTSRAYVESLRHSHEFLHLIAHYNLVRKASHQFSVSVTVPDWSPEQIEDDAIRGYNGHAGRDGYGHGLHEFRVVVDECGKIIVDIEPGTHRGKVRWERVSADSRQAMFPKGYPGDPDYLNSVRSQVP